MTHDPDITNFLFEHARDIILIIDAETGSIIDVNRAAEIAYRYTRAELLKLAIFDLRVDAPLSVEEQMRTANRDGILFHALHRRSDGSTFPVEISSRGDEMSGRRCLFSIIRDITERVRADEERENLLRQTQRALETRDEFLIIASHELRTPITNVSLKLQHLLRLCERPTSREELCAAGESALRESRRLASLIDMLLDAQVAKGHMVLKLADANLRDIATDVVDRMRPYAVEAGSQLLVDVPDIHGRWDRLRLEQVVTNLLFNAIKYGRGRPVRIAGRSMGSTATLEVIDQGIGVTRADSDRIFEKFERPVSADRGGLGLGLFFSRLFVEAHGGALDVTSTVGVGSTFRVTLPV
jgi:PAS domain S-box-containing protein